MAEKVKIKRDSLVKKLTKKVRGSPCRTDSCVSLSEEPSGGTAGAPVLKNRVQQEALLGVGAEAEVFPEGLWWGFIGRSEASGSSLWWREWFVLNKSTPLEDHRKEIKFNPRSSGKITELAGRRVHLVGWMIVLPFLTTPVPWLLQALEWKEQRFVDWTTVGWLLSILLCLVSLRMPRGW